jgi:hypothetical protein
MRFLHPMLLSVLFLAQTSAQASPLDDKSDCKKLESATDRINCTIAQKTRPTSPTQPAPAYKAETRQPPM